MRIALIQMNVTSDKKDNLFCTEEKVKRAADMGADIAILPEMFCCPYTNESFIENAEPCQGNIWNTMSKLAKGNNIYIVAGSIPESDNGKIYNTSFVFNRAGEQIARHRKLHLFDINIEGGQRFFESDTFTPGDCITTFETEFCTLGLCICFDMRFPEVSRLMTLNGARVIIAPAAFNMTTGPAHWEILFRQRAVDNQIFTIGVAPARDVKAEYVSYGNSIICSPWGTVLKRAGCEEEMVVHDINLEDINSIRAQLPLLKARRNDIYDIMEVSK